MKLRVAFQGEPGAFSEAAALDHFGPHVEAVPLDSFDKVFKSVEEGVNDFGMVPIENSLAGSIHHNYDLLLQHQLQVVGEHYLRVIHCLIALPEANLAGIKKVISHPQALAQCDGYLHSLHSIEIEPVYDTAGSVKLIKSLNDPTIAAIASHRAADLYGMKILHEGIEDHPENYTRFLIIGCQPVDPGDDAKTSIVFALENQPGALFKALSVFALRNIDLTKIESRPLAGKLWEYFFYIDFAGSTRDQAGIRALGHLGEYATMLRVLGSYPRSRIIS